MGGSGSVPDLHVGTMSPVLCSGSVPVLPVVLCRKDGSDCYLAGLFCLVGYILWAGHRLGLFCLVGYIWPTGLLWAVMLA
jgi:hypothetical protein